MTTLFSPGRARHAVGFAALLTGLLALAACSSEAPGASASASADPNAQTEPVSVQLSWIFNEEFAGEYFAETSGYYAEAGLGPVQLVPGPSAGVPELISGTADVAFSDAVTIGAAVAREQAPLKILEVVGRSANKRFGKALEIEATAAGELVAMAGVPPLGQAAAGQGK